MRNKEQHLNSSFSCNAFCKFYTSWDKMQKSWVGEAGKWAGKLCYLCFFCTIQMPTCNRHTEQWRNRKSCGLKEVQNGFSKHTYVALSTIAPLQANIYKLYKKRTLLCCPLLCGHLRAVLDLSLSFENSLLFMQKYRSCFSCTYVFPDCSEVEEV